MTPISRIFLLVSVISVFSVQSVYRLQPFAYQA